MIKYSLGCENSHEFEVWFATGEEYERLQKSGHLDCPQCGSSKIEKLLMAPSVRTTKGRQSIIASEAETSEPRSIGAKPQTPALPSVPSAQSVAMPGLPPKIHAQLVDQLKEFKKQVLANAENVGDKFGTEARKIHYGEAEKRGIYGNASSQEAAELLEEGIEILPIPVLPEDHN